MLMREALGKVVSIRPAPVVTAESIGVLEPFASITAVAVVDAFLELLKDKILVIRKRPRPLEKRHA